MWAIIIYDYICNADIAVEKYEIEYKKGDTIKDIKNELNKKFISGILKHNQYILTKECQILEDDFILEEENPLILNLDAKIDIMLKLPLLHFKTLCISTMETVDNIYDFIKKEYTNAGWDNMEFKIYYNKEEIEINRDTISSYNIYNLSTLDVVLM
jgi:hypothetical protein